MLLGEPLDGAGNLISGSEIPVVLRVLGVLRGSRAANSLRAFPAPSVIRGR
jgi:hypothetical protein